ncbi:curli assembly protein CsgG [Selenomonas sp. oral taxon 126]|uniref:CsgG/HfaB family protein n=1 Tax=Selenomonas sp. oral taxon 126 TaxID=712528 RepID=UPI000807818C|nr:CsgG/HfaB family protein [Selenomonas sp. oral taxon 126]ANR70035.1 curli assembly protein CsgG [Selenomonas sp. oral taxon 126]
MFKKMMGVLVLLGGLMMGSVCQAGLYDNPTVAVMPFQNKVPDRWGGFGDHAGVATEELITLISDRPDVFQVYERIEFQGLVDEQSLGMTGLIAEDSAVEVGNMSGVEYKIFGALTNLSAKEDTLGLGDLLGGLVGSQASVVANVSIRVVEVSTGRVVLVGQGKGSSKRVSGGVASEDGVFMLGSANVTDEMAFNAVSKAIKDAVNGKEGIFTKMGVNTKGKKR